MDICLVALTTVDPQLLSVVSSLQSSLGAVLCCNLASQRRGAGQAVCRPKSPVSAAAERGEKRP